MFNDLAMYYTEYLVAYDLGHSKSKSCNIRLRISGKSWGNYGVTLGTIRKKTIGTIKITISD